MTDQTPPSVSGHPLPPLLAGNRDPGVAAWRDRLPSLLPGLLEELRLVPDAPFSPGGTASWVAPVRRGPGSRASGSRADGADGLAPADGDLPSDGELPSEMVLKVSFAHDEARDEAAGMIAWQGRGAARVLHADLREGTSILLMERVRPGTTLEMALPWPEKDEVVAALARRLRMPAPADGPFRPLAHMCDWWADEAAARAEHAARAGRPTLPADLVAHGLDLFRSLPLDWDGEPSLLVTDLHHANVIARDDSEWVLIDPKPYVGDPHYDVLQHMLNDPERLRADPSAFADRMARLAELDPARVRRWLLARCVQESDGMPAAAAAARRLEADGVC